MTAQQPSIMFVGYDYVMGHAALGVRIVCTFT